jgi:hypothetical protein
MSFTPGMRWRPETLADTQVGALGWIMAGAMTAITNSGIRGPLPRTICLICLTLMWLESSLGLCVGCKVYAALLRRGWRTKNPEIVCAHGACDVRPRAATGRALS